MLTSIIRKYLEIKGSTGVISGVKVKTKIVIHRRDKPLKQQEKFFVCKPK